MIQKITSLFFVFVISLSAAYAQKYGNLTIFSEDGDKFYLILNGEKQNEVPQTNIRIEELNQPYYSARVIFEDKALQPITKNNLMIQDADGIFVDVTYKIKKDKNNKVKLNYYSQTAVQPDFIPPSGMYVHQFGQSSAPSQNTGNSNGSTTTTTTTTTTNNNDNIGASINVPGMNVNISISDPDFNEHSTTTHTTTTHQSSSTHSTGTTHQQNQQQQQFTGNCKGWPMSSADFSAAKNTIDESSFDDTKLSTAKSIVSANCVSTDQVVEICKLFSFEENKLAFAKFAYKYTTDPKSYFKVNNVFSFSASKEQLNSFIQGQ